MKDIPQDNEGEYTEEFKRSLRKSRSDFKNNRVYSLKEVKKMLFIK